MTSLGYPQVKKPSAVTLIIDRSGSMGASNSMELAKDNAIAFIESMGPNDNITVIQFSDEALQLGPTGR